MRVLVIDNGTSYLEKLKELLAGHAVVVVPFGDVDSEGVGDFDLIILSGGHKLPIVGNEDTFEKEIELVQEATIPLLGICFGFELIAHVFGSALVFMKAKEKGIVEIYPSVKSPLFEGIDNFYVYESHRWVVSDISDALMEVARSNDGIEMIQHENAPIYGFQFHPEMFVNETVGDDIFRNFLRQIEKPDK